MAGSRKGRTQPCNRRDARTRQSHARKFLEVADLVASDTGGEESASVAAALAVLAGIAAADAACCAALQERSRGEDHHEAEALLKQITPGGSDAAKDLRRLINLKDQAQYGFFNVSGADVKKALRAAGKVVSFADEVLSR